MKTCFKCGDAKLMTEFYAHPMMADGHLGKCKECTKRDVTLHRALNIDRLRSYDRERSKLPHRMARTSRIVARWLKVDKRRGRCHRAAKRHHRKAPEACQMCGLTKRLERHHPDYDLPLLIVWLCKPCHCVADKTRRAREVKDVYNAPTLIL